VEKKPEQTETNQRRAGGDCEEPDSKTGSSESTRDLLSGKPWWITATEGGGISKKRRAACLRGKRCRKEKKPEDAIVRTHGEPRQRRGIQLTDGDVASGEDETREPRCASGEHNQRTDSANGMKTRDASGDALREKMLRRSTARNPRLTAARLLRARPLGTAQP
jgi:hypothetical protein